MEAKFNKARHHFSREVSWNIPANFQPIPSEDGIKRAKNCHSYVQFYFIDKKKKNLFIRLR